MPGSSPLRLFAHRGVSARFPENTLAAFAAARDSGCAAIELDVRLTRDERLVVFHDDDLTRLAGDPARIDQLTYEELLAFDVGAWKGAEFRGTRIPTLEQVWETYPAGLVNVEMKPSEGANRTLAREVARFLQNHAESRAVVSSFDWPLLEAFRRYDAKTQLGVLFDNDRWGDAKNTARQLGAGALNAAWIVAVEDEVRSAREGGFEIHVFTVNAPDVARKMQSIGVTGLFTDDAPAMAAALGQPP